MEYIIGWIVFSLVAGAVGRGRQIGFWGAFLLSIFLSPLIGLIIAFASKRKEIQTKTENENENKTEDFDKFRID